MRLKVTEQGIFIPKELLEGIEEVEVSRNNDVIFLTSTQQKQSIWEMGTNPVPCDVDDASINHDKYLYQGE